MADLATLQTRLVEAERAQHDLAMGASVTEVWRDGRRVTFSSASPKDLDAYVAKLRNDIADAQAVEQGSCDGYMSGRRPFTPVW